MRKTLYSPHLWIILAIMTCGAVIYYADRVPWIQDIQARAPFELARYSTHRILSIIPVAYAAYVFRFKGGAITAVFISLALLPRSFFLTTERAESYAEIIAFLVIGLLVSWLIDRQRSAVNRLQDTQKELTDSIQTIKQQQQQLASLYVIATVVYRTLDVIEIAKSSLHEALQVTGAETGWIYLKDDESGDLVLSAHRGLSEQHAIEAQRIGLGQNIDGQVAKSGAPTVVERISPKFGLKLTGREGTDSILVAPLRTRAGIEGTLGIATNRHQSPGASQLDLLVALGDTIGIAIGHARLHKKEKSFDQQMRFSEELYRGLFENASEAIFICSSIGRILSVNRACEQLTGYEAGELLDFTIYKLFSTGSLNEVEQLLSVKLEQGIGKEANELCLIRKDGKEAFVELKVSPLFRGNESMGLQIIARDVTEERQLRQNMQYYVSQITRAQEDERLRIARELHDDTAQLLISLSREIDSLVSERSRIPRPAVERLKKLRETTDLVLEGVRRYSQDLRPSILGDLGLVPALEWLIADLDKGYGLETTVRITGEKRRLPPDNELAVFRIAQEVLSNVKRHSGATRVDMTVDFDNDAMTLVICDNGQGFDMPDRTSDLGRSGKLGIIGMRERARLIGGTLIVQSAAGAGTTVTLRAPG